MVSVVSCGKKTWAVKLVRNKLHGLIMAFNQEKVVLFQEYTRCDQHTYGASVYDSPFHTNDRNICESMHATNTLVVRCKNKTFYLHMHQKHTWNSNQQVQTEGHGCSTKHKFQINTGSSDRIWVEVRLKNSNILPEMPHCKVRYTCALQPVWTLQPRMHQNMRGMHH